MPEANPAPAASNPRNPWHCRGDRGNTALCTVAERATTCITAGTTF